MGAAHLKAPAVPATPRVSGCTNKVGYPSRRAALADIIRADNLNPAIKPYRCPNCRDWHVTSMDKASVKRVKRYHAKVAEGVAARSAD